MLMTVEELRQFITTDKSDTVLEAMLQALELTIRNYTNNTFTKNGIVEYPADVKMAAVNILKWQLRNEAAAAGDKSQKDVQSETISRHSVTYATDATESDLSIDFGVPKKLVACLKLYKKARF